MKFVSLILGTSVLSTTCLAQTVLNPGFETPNLGAGHYSYRPTGADWSGINDWGIANGNGPWGTQAHSGSQYGYIQKGSKDAAYIQQIVTGLTVGKVYHVKFYMARRNGNQGADIGNPLSVLLDGVTILGSTAPSGDGAWFQYVTSDFTATQTSSTLKFLGMATSADKTSLLDDISVEEVVPPSPGVFLNPGFEAPTLLPHQWYQGPTSTDTAWMGTFGWGIANGSGSWGKAGIEGQQYAYLQSSGTAATIYQSVSGLVPGQVYYVRFSMARRNGNVGGNNGIGVKVTLDDSTVIFPYTAPSGDGRWTTTESGMFLATKDTYKFSWKTSGSSGDSATLLDRISLRTRKPILPVFTNSSFEMPALATDTFSANPTNSNVAWTGRNWGVANGNTTWGTGGFSSSQYAYIQSKRDIGAGEIDGTLSDLVIGQSYKVTFYVAIRAGATSRLNPLSVVLEDGTVLMSDVRPTKTGEWKKRITATFTATADTMTVRFVGSAPTGGLADATTLIDAITLLKD